jgi:hypothetical protein
MHAAGAVVHQEAASGEIVPQTLCDYAASSSYSGYISYVVVQCGRIIRAAGKTDESLLYMCTVLMNCRLSKRSWSSSGTPP